ncbi:MAG: hypothetical protein NZ898_10705 [Myxococcota bacterium]|nr:hypothetical protein [Myxococcota bacterium]MDW8363837.1 hypothetical protein [Myxococcales bacterium]
MSAADHDLDRAERWQVRIPLASARPPADRMLEIWHGWIRDRTLPELLVDVVSYEHVHEGPGIVLVGHESDYYLDRVGPHGGLVHFRKRGGPRDGAASRLLDAAAKAFDVALRLRQDSRLPELAFDTTRLTVRVPDRLHAPVHAASRGALVEVLQSVAQHLYAGIDMRVEANGDERQPLAATLVAAADPGLESLLHRARAAPGDSAAPPTTTPAT